MHPDEGALDDHLKFKEWSALAHAGALSGREWQELESHLHECGFCRELYEEYSLISEGMPLLGANYRLPREFENWDDRAVRQNLLAQIKEKEEELKHRPTLVTTKSRDWASRIPSWKVGKSWVHAAGIAACLVVAVAAAAYHLGGEMHGTAIPSGIAASPQVQELSAQKQAAEELLDSQAAQISQLQKQVSSNAQELVRLQAASTRASSGYASALSAAASKDQEQLRLLSEQRDKLAIQLREAEQAYQNVQLELTNLRADRDRTALRAASLQSKVDELTTANRDQEHKLGDDEQYLASDRDIRELMGARKLYIADVFDVDSRSRTRKPFGRVFYTQNKSLIFYAFDLDREPGVKNASAFQVWGQKDNELTEKSHPTNLGILYMDSESNRRWVLRFDDSKQLADIDAVFVTVEPHGGSQKPTGKPLLYALLRKEANHP
jgi:hypothetical protein